MDFHVRECYLIFETLRDCRLHRISFVMGILLSRICSKSEQSLKSG